jgi:uncharacterized radical SAM superfamily Fe-S cluster-containing enzyme
LWLYTNFDCNLACDYCCVRSSPTTPRRALGLERVQRITAEARALGPRELYVTGGEPFILKDIGDILRMCAQVAPTTVLTNGMLFDGSRLQILRSIPRDGVTLQISVDSPTPELHDLHRGNGTWKKAWNGVELARREGFRVRVAATVARQEDEHRFRAFLDERGVPEEDRVVRRVALRGVATDGVALARADLVPELTLTDSGVYWHPVGATDVDLLVTSELFPLRDAIAKADALWREDRSVHQRLAEIFHCA